MKAIRKTLTQNGVEIYLQKMLSAPARVCQINNSTRINPKMVTAQKIIISDSRFNFSRSALSRCALSRCALSRSRLICLCLSRSCARKIQITVE